MMKRLVFGFLLLGTAAGLSYVPPAGNQLSFLEVLKDIFLGKELKDFPRCGQPTVFRENEDDSLEKGKRQVSPSVPECIGETVVTSHEGFGNGTDYPNNLATTTYIYSKRSFIKATFNYLDIEPSPRCSLDYVEFRDAAEDTVPGEKLCGNAATPLDLFFKTTKLKIIFKTDQVTTAKGFCVKLDCGTEECIKLTEEQFQKGEIAVEKAKQDAEKAEQEADQVAN